MQRKINLDQGLQRQRLEQELVQARMELAKLRQHINEDKKQLDQVLKAQKARSEASSAGDKGRNLAEELQGGEPADKQTKSRRDVVRNVSCSIAMTAA